MNADEFDAFYQTSFRRLVGQIYAMCGSFAEAQDCVQEAFVRAWDKRAQLTAQSPEAWVRTVAYRLAVSRWRKLKNAELLKDRSLNHRTPYIPDVENIALSRALAQLSPAHRQVVVLHHVADLPVADIAREIGAPVGTVKARLTRARRQLAELLGEPAEDLDRIADPPVALQPAVTH